MADEEETTPESPSRRLEFVRFVVDDRPYACWEWNLRERNLEFLRGIDPSYYTYVAAANSEHLEDEEHGRQAALAIRVAYAQALETLFALLGAMVQAPECVFGWLLAYRNVELESLVRKLSRREAVLNRLNIEPTWESLSSAVHQFSDYDDEKKDWIATGYARAWARFAGEFLNEKASAEYNSIKHGLRTRVGGFQLSYGIEKVYGKAVPPEEMKSLGGSKYGTSFYTIEKLGEGRTNFRARRVARNWIPDNMAEGLHLLAWSIGNVVCALRIVNGEKPGGCRFHNPNSPEMFDVPWRLSPGVTDCSFDSELSPEQVEPRSKQEILDSYDREPRSGSDS